MNAWLAALNSVAAAWAEAWWRASWQGAVALGLVWLICRLATRLPAELHCWFWRLAYLKVLVALCWAIPINLPLLPPHTTGPLRSHPEVFSANERGFEHSIPPPLKSALATRPDAPVGRPQAKHPSWESVLLLGWLLGVGWQLTRLQRQRRLRLEPISGARLCQDPGTSQLLTALCDRLGLHQRPELLIADVPGPQVIGSRRPVILLPEELNASAVEREWVLAHELAHVKRRDLWWAYLPASMQVLFFFHPVIWLAHRELRLAQEMACDALTVRITTARASDYGELLVRFASRKRGTPAAGITGAGILESGVSLERRLKMLRSIPILPHRQALCARTVLALALICMVPWHVSAQPSTAPAPPRSTPHPLGEKSPSTSTAPAARGASPAKPHAMVAVPSPRPPRVVAGRPAAPRAKTSTPSKPKPKVAANRSRPRSKGPIAAKPVPPASPAVSDPSLLQAAGVNVGPYAALIAALTPEELLQYLATERNATQQLLQTTRARVQNGSGATAELVPLETKAAQLDILVRAAERLAQRPPAARRTDLYAVLSPAELVQFLRTELQGARSLRDLAQARYQAGITPNTELLPLEARTQQLEILVRAAERRMVKPE